MGTCVAELFALLCVFLLCRTTPSIQAEKHSLYYIYTGLSKPVDLPGIYQFTAMGLLDDIQIDYYNSEEQRNIPKQTWMKEKMPEDYWEEDTKYRKDKEHWINENIVSLMKCNEQNESDLHVLQWRHGCEFEQQRDEPKRIEKYCYDGEDILSFDYKESQWVDPVGTSLMAKWKFDNVPILKQHSTGYLEKECVDWLNTFREYADEELRKASPPDVHVFAKKSSDETKLKLSCMATGFYTKNVTLFIKKDFTSLPENEIKSTGIRPNPNETFQMKNSVEISKDEKAEYDCFFRSNSDLIIVKWDGKCLDCLTDTFIIKIGAGIVCFLLALVALVVYIIIKKGIHAAEAKEDSRAGRQQNTDHSSAVLCFLLHKGNRESEDSSLQTTSNISADSKEPAYRQSVKNAIERKTGIPSQSY